MPRFNLGSPILTNKGWISQHHYRVDNARVDGTEPQSGRLVCYWIADASIVSMPYWEGDFLPSGEKTYNSSDISPAKVAIEGLCQSMNKSLTGGFVPKTLAPGITIESNWRRFF
jgi:hypothetical protein